MMTGCRDPGILPRQDPDPEWLAGRMPRTRDVEVNGHMVQVSTGSSFGCHAMHALVSLLFYGSPSAVISVVALFYRHLARRCILEFVLAFVSCGAHTLQS